jgi:di/tricarboxylate transporter
MLTADMILVLLIIAAAVFLFIVEWVRVDVVAIIIMLTLPLLGLVSGQEAFVGFSSNAVISIIAVIIIGAGLDRTGIMNKVAKPITKLAGNSESRLITFVSATVAVISSFMQNIGAVALFLPATQRVCKKMGVSTSRVLMPMGFLGIIGGCLTLVGSSPLILLNDLIATKDLEPFGLFDVTPVGIVLVIGALAYFVLFGKLVIPSRAEESTEGDSEAHQYDLVSDTFELKLPRDWESDKTLDEMGVRRNYLVTVISVADDTGKNKILSPTRDMKLIPGGSIAVSGNRKNVEMLATRYGFTLVDKPDVFEDELSSSTSGMVEAIVTPQSDLEGKTLRQVHFRAKYQLNPLAIKRMDKIFYAGLSDITLKVGDILFLQGQWSRFTILRDSRMLSFLTPFEAEVIKTHKANMAVMSFAVAIALITFTDIKLSVALMTGALGMILTGVLKVDEAYEAVDWRTVFLLAGLIPLGIATEKTGTAELIANLIVGALGDVSSITLMLVIGIMTSVFTLVVSNVGATVLLVPLVVNMAISSGADPRIAALTVAIAASNTFVLPTHQVNAFIMGPGGYKTVDYLRAGSVMTFLYLGLMTGAIYVFFM